MLVDPTAARLKQEDEQIAVMRARKVMVDLSRKFPAIFNTFVLRDEQTGKPIEQGPVHDRWHVAIDKHPRLVLWSHVEAGKTQQISIGRTLHKMGLQPNLRGAIVSNTGDMAKKIVRALGQYIEKSDELHAVFPRLRPTSNPALPWTSMSLTVERDVISKDPTIQACGVHGNILGSRLDWVVLDDILDYENTHSPQAREDTWRWLKASVLGRLTANAQVVVIGNAWHPEDVMHKLVEESGYKGLRFPVRDKAGHLSWPARWPITRIEATRVELGPLEFARQMLCMARDDSQARFKREWVDKCVRRGDGYRLVHRVDELPEGFFIITGVDLAVQKHAAAGLTVFFTICLWPDGTRQILNIDAARLSGPEILARLEDLHERYGGVFIVENNAAQQYLHDFAAANAAMRANIRAFTTGRNKAHPEYGIESMAAELDRGQWIIPSKRGRVDDQIDRWIGDLLYYDPQGHTGDRLMASWFAREGCRMLQKDSQRSGGVGVRVFG